jgi:hypothetical protein
MIHIIIIIVLVVVIGTFISISMTNKSKEVMAAKIQAIPNFTPSQSFMGVDGRTGFAIDEKRAMLCLISKTDEFVSTRLVLYADIVSVELTEDGSSITKTSRSSQLGGALVGGVLLGGVGAVVGGLTGSTKTSQKIKNVNLRVVIDDTKSPLHNVSFQNVEGARDGLIHNAALTQARHWNGLFDVVIRRADQARIRDVNVANPVEVKDKPSGSLADELKKLADLKADGVLTNDEFQTQKQRLLSRV